MWSITVDLCHITDFNPCFGKVGPKEHTARVQQCLCSSKDQNPGLQQVQDHAFSK